MPDETDPGFRAELLRVERNRWIMGLLVAPIFLGAILLGVSALTDPLLPVGLMLFMFGGIGSAAAWRKNPRPRVRPRLVTADAQGLRLGDALVPRASLRAGFVKPGLVAPHVVLRRRFGLPLELRARDTAEARRLLSALGLDVTQRVAEFRASSRVLAKRSRGASIGLALGLSAAALGATARGTAHSGAMAAAFVAFLVSLFAFAVLMAVPSRVRVGADGLEIRWLGTSRFIRYDQIAGVVRYDSGWGNSRVNGLRIVLRTQESVAIPMHQGSFQDGEERALLEERIREGQEAARGGSAEVEAAMLERGDRSMAHWVAALRAIGAGANATLRTAPLPPDRLFRIVEDPRLPETARAAAAVALGAAIDDDGRRRLRLAAEATAAPRLRVSLERAAAGGGDAELEAVLAEVETGGRRRRS